MSQLVNKVTLSTTKEVLLRPIKIKDQEHAAQSAAAQVNSDSQLALAVVMQKEMIKLLIVQIDGERPSAASLEDLDSLLEYSEYMELAQVLNSLTGGDSKAGKVQTELVSYGNT